MTTTRTVLDRIEPMADGAISVRLCKQTWKDERIAASGWHRIVLPPGSDAMRILAANSDHLQAMGFPPISDSDIRAILNAAPR